MFPSYLNLSNNDWQTRIEEAYKILERCELCARKCGINRLEGEIGFCKGGLLPKVSSHNLHFGEEPPISGISGSGTIFFTGCTMRCCFCQNYPISQLGVGNEVSIEKLADMMIQLQERKAHNINFVTPTHFVPQIIKALFIAKNKGLQIPIVYNTGGYDALKTLKLLDGIIDIYMPDAKYGDDKMAEKYSEAPGYVETNQEALKEMHSQVWDLKLKNNIAERGLLVRVLLLPNDSNSSEKVLKFLYSISENVYISLMTQYFPANRAQDFSELSRGITIQEYERAYATLKSLNLRGYIQKI